MGTYLRLKLADPGIVRDVNQFLNEFDESLGIEDGPLCFSEEDGGSGFPVGSNFFKVSFTTEDEDVETFFQQVIAVRNKFGNVLDWSASLEGSLSDYPDNIERLTEDQKKIVLTKPEAQKPVPWFDLKKLGLALYTDFSLVTQKRDFVIETLPDETVSPHIESKLLDAGFEKLTPEQSQAAYGYRINGYAAPFLKSTAVAVSKLPQARAIRVTDPKQMFRAYKETEANKAAFSIVDALPQELAQEQDTQPLSIETALDALSLPSEKPILAVGDHAVFKPHKPGFDSVTGKVLEIERSTKKTVAYRVLPQGQDNPAHTVRLWQDAHDILKIDPDQVETDEIKVGFTWASPDGERQIAGKGGSGSFEYYHVLTIGSSQKKIIPVKDIEEQVAKDREAASPPSEDLTEGTNVLENFLATLHPSRRERVEKALNTPVDDTRTRAYVIEMYIAAGHNPGQKEIDGVLKKGLLTPDGELLDSFTKVELEYARHLAPEAPRKDSPTTDDQEQDTSAEHTFNLQPEALKAPELNTDLAGMTRPEFEAARDAAMAWEESAITTLRDFAIKESERWMRSEPNIQKDDLPEAIALEIQSFADKEQGWLDKDATIKTSAQIKHENWLTGAERTNAVAAAKQAVAFGRHYKALNDFFEAEKNRVLSLLFNDEDMKAQGEFDLYPHLTPVSPESVNKVPPPGWTESAPGRITTNKDPVHGGIIDRNIASGLWFVIPQNDNIQEMEGFSSRADAYAALVAKIEELNVSPKPGDIVSVGDEPRRTNNSSGNWVVDIETAVPFGSGKTKGERFFFKKQEAEEFIRTEKERLSEDLAASPAPESDAEKDVAGFSWDSVDGKKTVLGPAKGRPEGWLEIEKEDSRFNQYIHQEEIAEEVAFDTKKLASQKESQAQEAIRAAEKDAQRTVYEDVKGFAENMDPMTKARVLKTLNKLTTVNGEIVSRKKMIEDLVSAGAQPGTRQEDKVKPMPRRASFRASQEEQEDHEQRVREAGKKTVYTISNPHNPDAWYEVTKTEHDYANYLISTSPKEDPEADTSEINDKSKAIANLSAADLKDLLRKDPEDAGFTRAEILREVELRFENGGFLKDLGWPDTPDARYRNRYIGEECLLKDFEVVDFGIVQDWEPDTGINVPLLNEYKQGLESLASWRDKHPRKKNLSWREQQGLDGVPYDIPGLYSFHDSDQPFDFIQTTLKERIANLEKGLAADGAQKDLQASGNETAESDPVLFFEEARQMLVQVGQGPKGNYTFYRTKDPKKQGSRIKSTENWYDTREEAEAALPAYAAKRGFIPATQDHIDQLTRKSFQLPKIKSRITAGDLKWLASMAWGFDDVETFAAAMPGFLPENRSMADMLESIEKDGLKDLADFFDAAKEEQEKYGPDNIAQLLIERTKEVEPAGPPTEVESPFPANSIAGRARWDEIVTPERMAEKIPQYEGWYRLHPTPEQIHDRLDSLKGLRKADYNLDTINTQFEEKHTALMSQIAFLHAEQLTVDNVARRVMKTDSDVALKYYAKAKELDNRIQELVGELNQAQTFHAAANIKWGKIDLEKGDEVIITNALDPKYRGKKALVKKVIKTQSKVDLDVQGLGRYVSYAHNVQKSTPAPASVDWKNLPEGWILANEDIIPDAVGQPALTTWDFLNDDGRVVIVKSDGTGFSVHGRRVDKTITRPVNLDSEEQAYTQAVELMSMDWPSPASIPGVPVPNAFGLDLGLMGQYTVSISNEPDLPAGHTVIAGELYTREIKIPQRDQKLFGLEDYSPGAFRVTIIENQDGERYSHVEYMADNHRNGPFIEATFKPLKTDALEDIRALKPVNNFAGKLWIKEKEKAERAAYASVAKNSSTLLTEADTRDLNAIDAQGRLWDLQGIVDRMPQGNAKEKAQAEVEQVKDRLNSIALARYEALKTDIYSEHEETSYQYEKGDERRYFQILKDIESGVIPTRYEKRDQEEAQKRAEREHQYELGYDRNAYGEPTTGKNFYYVTAVKELGTSLQKEALALGPFTSHLEALRNIEVAKKATNDPFGDIAFGTAGTDNDLGPGRLNDLLGFPKATIETASTPSPVSTFPDPENSDTKPWQQPSVVFREIRDFDGKLLGYMHKAFDGQSKEDALDKARALSVEQIEAVYPGFSNVNSRIGATDPNGKPLFAISPNLRHAHHVLEDRDAAMYTWGDLEAGQRLISDDERREMIEKYQGYIKENHVEIQGLFRGTVTPDDRFDSIEDQIANLGRINQAHLNAINEHLERLGEPPFEPEPHQFRMGDLVEYENALWEVGFINQTFIKGSLRLQKNGESDAEQVNHIFPDKVRLISPALPQTPEQEPPEKESLFDQKKEALKRAYAAREYTLYYQFSSNSWNLTIAEKIELSDKTVSPGQLRLTLEDKEEFLDVDRTIKKFQDLLFSELGKDHVREKLDQIKQGQAVVVDDEDLEIIGKIDPEAMNDICSIPDPGQIGAKPRFLAGFASAPEIKQFRIDNGLEEPDTDPEEDRPAEDKFPAVLPYNDQRHRHSKYIGKLFNDLGIAEEIANNDEYYGKIFNDPWMPLTIERHGDQIFLTHYYEQNGDLVMDGEMVFQLYPETGHLKLKETAVQNVFKGGELRGCDATFANIFAKNLNQQGFGECKVVDPRNQEQAPEEKSTEGHTAEDFDPTNPMYYKLGGEIPKASEIKSLNGLIAKRDDEYDLESVNFAVANRFVNPLLLRDEIEKEVQFRKTELEKHIDLFETARTKGIDALEGIEIKGKDPLPNFLAAKYQQIREGKSWIKDLKGVLVQLDQKAPLKPEEIPAETSAFLDGDDINLQFLLKQGGLPQDPSALLSLLEKKQQLNEAQLQDQIDRYSQMLSMPYITSETLDQNVNEIQDLKGRQQVFELAIQAQKALLEPEEPAMAL